MLHTTRDVLASSLSLGTADSRGGLTSVWLAFGRTAPVLQRIARGPSKLRLRLDGLLSQQRCSTRTKGFFSHQAGGVLRVRLRERHVVIWHNSLSLEAVMAAHNVHARRGHELGKRLSFVSVLSARVAFQFRGAGRIQGSRSAGVQVSLLRGGVEADGMWRSAVRVSHSAASGHT